MTMDDIAARLRDLHREASQLMTQGFKLHPSTRMVFSRAQLNELESQLDRSFQSFVELDAELLKHAGTPMDINTATRHAAHMQVLYGVRDSVRGLLTDAADAAASLRSRLDVLGTVYFSAIAILLAVAALFV